MESLRERVRPLYLRSIYFPLFPGRKPPAFDRCWTFPAIGRHQLQTGQASPDLLFLPMTDWHARMQRTQFLARGFAAEGHRCFLLNPHMGREFPSRGGDSVRICRLETNVYEIHVRLPREPVFHHRLLRQDETELIASAIRGVVNSSFVSVVSFPVWRPVAQQLGAPVIYDCHDLLSGFDNIHPSIVENEKYLIRSASLTVASSGAVLDHCKAVAGSGANCTLLRNGVDLAEFQPDARDAPRKHAGRKTVGYVGALEDWFDTRAIERAAQAHPEWDFVLAGRRESGRLDALRKYPNVQFTGEIDRADVPAFLGRLDVGLIPFVLNPLTVAADPIKLYEYFAAGLPVAASRLPETFRFRDMIHYYNAPEELAGGIEQALQDGRDRERRNAVRPETWACRVKALKTLLPSPGSGITGIHA